MKKCKYVITGYGLAILFDEILSHSNMIGRSKCRAAGFVRFEPSPDGVHERETQMYGNTVPNIKIVCYGKSESLGGIESRGEVDEEIIRDMLCMK